MHGDKVNYCTHALAQGLAGFEDILRTFTIQQRRGVGDVPEVYARELYTDTVLLYLRAPLVHIRETYSRFGFTYSFNS